VKKPLGLDDLIARVRAVAGALPDPRTGDNTQFSMADIALAAFAVFFTQCPSFLSFQQNMEQARSRNNARSLFQVERIPTDNHIRQTLDPVAPEHLMALFDDLHRAFDEHGLLPAMRAVQNSRLIALDATWYFSWHSKNIHCPNCSCITHADGQVTHFHSAITPVIVSPGHAQVVPLRPEFITPQDGHAKQDCEIAAAKRWLAAQAARYHTGNDTLLGDDPRTGDNTQLALHTFLEVTDADYQLIRGKVGARRTFLEHLRALTTYLPFENWMHLMDFMMRGLENGPHAIAKN
jgi:hypothetical protein